MVPLVSAAGEKQVIRLEEWKNRLAEKWESAEIALPKGGFMAWCMHVLPESEKTRWSRIFKV